MSKLLPLSLLLAAADAGKLELAGSAPSIEFQLSKANTASVSLTDSGLSLKATEVSVDGKFRAPFHQDGPCAMLQAQATCTGLIALHYGPRQNGSFKRRAAGLQW